MKKSLYVFTVVASILIIIYGVSLVLDYMVTLKYHVHGSVKDRIIYTTEARAKEISFLNRYFYLTIGFGFLSLITSLVAIFSKK